ncbi:hypothetical protein ABBQ38_003979 [Trebouxia sp. C0009 RCD-2024]
MADMTIAAQYEALSKLLQPVATEDPSKVSSQRSQPSSRTTAESLVDPVHTTQIALASGRAYPSNASGGIWEDTEVQDQVTVGPANDSKETPKYYPPSHVAELDLDVQPLKILLASPAYMLTLPLPHKIDEKQSSAKWITKKKQLTLTMRIVRDV